MVAGWGEGATVLVGAGAKKKKKKKKKKGATTAVVPAVGMPLGVQAAVIKSTIPSNSYKRPLLRIMMFSFDWMAGFGRGSWRPE